MEVSLRSASRIGTIALGIVSVAVSVSLIAFSAVALLRGSVGGPANGWLAMAIVLAVAMVPLVVGVFLIRRGTLGVWEWLFVGFMAFGPVLFPAADALKPPEPGEIAEVEKLLTDMETADRVAAQVNRVVAQKYAARADLATVTADCTRAEMNEDRSESWFCEMGAASASDSDSCLVTVVLRPKKRVSAVIDYCLNETLEEVEGLSP